MVVVTTPTFPLLRTELHNFHLQTTSLYRNDHRCRLNLNPNEHQIKFNISSITRKGRRIGRRGGLIVVVAVIEPSTAATELTVDSAANVVRKFYGGINERNLSSVENLIADNCVYEDLVFPKPFIGRKAILGFFKEFMDSISKDLQFAIDDISEDDTVAVGVTWHLEWKGKAFPFSKGCSFYKLEVVNGQRQIVYGRDVVEPFIKPGDMALAAISGVTWLLQRFPQLADRL